MAEQQQYPAPSITVSAGNLSCGARMFAADRVQTWCWAKETAADGTPLPWSLAHNTIGTLTADRAVIDGYVSGPDQVLWMIWIAPGGTTVQFQVSATPTFVQSGVMPAGQ